MNRYATLCVIVVALSWEEVSAGLWSGSSSQQHDSVAEDTPITTDEKVEYGVDVSFPMHHASVSTNYPWLEHNVHSNIPTPEEYKDMVIQPLGDRQTFYKDFLDGCREAFGSRGSRCTNNELDRIEMSLRQPQSMQVRIMFRKFAFLLQNKKRICGNIQDANIRFNLSFPVYF